MDRKTILAVALCFLIFLGWQKFVIEPKQKQDTVAVTTTAAVAPTATASPVMSAQAPAKPVTVPPTKTIETKTLAASTGVVSVSSANQIVSGWTLKDYKEGLDADAKSIELSKIINKGSLGQLAFDLPEYSYLANVVGALTVQGNEAVWLYEDANVRLERRMRATEQAAALDVEVTATFKAKRPGYAFVSLTADTPANDTEEQDRQLIYWANNSIERVSFKDVGELKEPRSANQGLKWIGATSRYFVAALLAGGNTSPTMIMQPNGMGAGRISLVYPITGDTIKMPLRAFVGPKDLDVLRSVEPTLDHTVDFGWFTIFAYPLLKVMKWFYQFVHNYGVSIILLTILVKLLTYPLTYKSMKSMKEMAKLQPQLQKLREKHKDDKEALNREMLGLMKTHGYNPMAGCLPILIQMPIFIALYRVLYSAIELYHAPFALWIHDLSVKDPYYVTPVLLTGLMWLQQKMTPNTATDPVQAKMMQFMPIMFGIFMVTLPSGLTIYMLVNSIMSIIQQLWMNRKLDGGRVAA